MQQVHKIENHKAERQRVKRMARKGNRYARQKAQRRLGPNVRLRLCVSSGNPYMGYTYIRQRDGSTV